MYVPMCVEAGGQPQVFLRSANFLLKINSFCSFPFTDIFFSGAGAVAQDLRALGAHADYPSLVPNKHRDSQLPVTPVLIWLLGTCAAMHIFTPRHSSIHILKTFRKFLK